MAKIKWASPFFLPPPSCFPQNLSAPVRDSAPPSLWSCSNHCSFFLPFSCPLVQRLEDPQIPCPEGFPSLDFPSSKQGEFHFHRHLLYPLCQGDLFGEATLAGNFN